MIAARDDLDKACDVLRAMASGDEAALDKLGDLDAQCLLTLDALAAIFTEIAWQAGLEPRAIAMELLKRVPSGKAWQAEYQSRRQRGEPRLGPWAFLDRRPSSGVAR